MAKRPGLLALAMAVAAVLAACQQPPQLNYVNEEYGFSFLPPKDWAFSAKASDECLATAEAVKDASCRVYVCVRPRLPDLVSSRDDYLNCEQIKTYIRDRLKGQNVECEAKHDNRYPAYQARYLRLVRRGEGTATQFVEQKFVVRNQLLYTVTAYTLGETPEAARDIYTQNLYQLSLSMNSLYFR